MNKSTFMQRTESFCDTASFTTLETSEILPVEISDEGAAIRFRAPAGLYQFSVIADARDFDWDELYVELNAYHNTGQRSGPWDFNPLKNNYPLVPSYWVFLDNEKIGLWYFQRVSLEDLAAKHFRGRMAFWLRDGDARTEHELKFIPYRPIKLDWISARLETDPEDTVSPSVKSTFNSTPQIYQWSDDEFWQAKQRQLETTHAAYQEPLRHAFDAAIQKEKVLPGAPALSAKAPNEWNVLIAAHRLGKRKGALEELLRAVDESLALPHWGNPREDGYGHDGDMYPAFTMRAMAWAYHGLGSELGEDRRARMREKMALQGKRFIDLALLNRDYWGGSLLQDHGWRSVHTFCFAALALLNVIPEAGEWLRYFLPRVRRAEAAMPRDGVVPETSHNSLILYLDDISDLREILLAWNGEDIYDANPFHTIVDFISATWTNDSPQQMIGGNGFFNQIASKYHDETAAWISQRLLQIPEKEWTHFSQRQGYYADVVRGFLTDDSTIPAVPPPPSAPLQFFPDSGRVYFFDTEKDISFQVTCAPYAGYHAYRHATGPCDRMGAAPGEGHFELRRGGTALLATPDSGYALQSAIRSCLLIDGKGQYGDIGYPMSIPSKIHRGEEIEYARWDEKTQAGAVRLHLTPAYPDAAKLANYTREFLITPRQIIVRDYVTLNEAKLLSWLFQGKRENGLELIPDKSTFAARFGSLENGVKLEAQSFQFDIKAAIHLTPVVWSYSSASGFKPFDHVRFDSIEPMKCATVDFVIRW
jgi:hypothetical protein